MFNQQIFCLSCFVKCTFGSVVSFTPWKGGLFYFNLSTHYEIAGPLFIIFLMFAVLLDYLIFELLSSLLNTSSDIDCTKVPQKSKILKKKTFFSESKF